MKKLTMLSLVMGILFCSYQMAPAAPFDGKVPLLCAVVDASECTAGIGCLDTTVEIMDIPQFLKIDLKKKKITAADTKKDTRSTKIVNSSLVSGNHILQGKSENGRGWNVIISEESGKMTATVIDNQFGFFLFGACTSVQQ